MWFYGRLYCLLLLLPWSSNSANAPSPLYKRFVNGTSSSTSSSRTTSYVATTLSTIQSPSLANKKETTSHVTTAPSTSRSSSLVSSLAPEKTTTGDDSDKLAKSAKSSTKKKAKSSTKKKAKSSTYKSPNQRCSEEALKTTVTHIPCRVSVGTVQLHYWPTGAAAQGKVFPATKVLTQFKNFTMTSPSVYYVINTMSAYELCDATKKVGSVLKNYITSFDLKDVKTLQPFGVTSGIIDLTRIGEAQQLRLSDLRSDCPRYTAGDRERNTVGSPKCNPVLEWHPRLKKAQKKWAGCGRRHGGHFGIFDPPVPVQACLSNDCGNEGAEVLEPTITPIPSPTALADQQSTATASPAAALTPSPGPTTTQANIFPSPTLIAHEDDEDENEDDDDEDDDDEDVNFPSNEQEDVKTPVADATPTPDQANSPTTPPKVVAGETPKDNSSLPPATGTSKVIVDGTSALAGAPTTPSEQDQTASPNIPSKPTQIPQTIATVAGQLIQVSAVDSSVVVIGGQTISIGGQEATITGNQIISLASDGIVVNVPGGKQTTIAVPNSISVDKVATVAGQVLHISALQSSIVVIGTHTISIGGGVVTISANQVVSLGSSGIVVQVPGGTETTIAVPQIIDASPTLSALGVVTLTTTSTTTTSTTTTSTTSTTTSTTTPPTKSATKSPTKSVTTSATTSITTQVNTSSDQPSLADEQTGTRTIIAPAPTPIGQIINDMITTSGVQSWKSGGNELFMWFGSVVLGLGLIDLI